MNCATHGLHSTCPQGFASTALRLLLSCFLQDGQMRVFALGSEEEDSSVKMTGTRVLRLVGCGFEAVEAGQMG